MRAIDEAKAGRVFSAAMSSDLLEALGNS